MSSEMDVRRDGNSAHSDDSARCRQPGNVAVENSMSQTMMTLALDCQRIAQMAHKKFAAKDGKGFFPAYTQTIDTHRHIQKQHRLKLAAMGRKLSE